MIIAHVTYGLAIGGIETMLVNIANEQAAAGHNVHIAVINDLIDENLANRINPKVTLHTIGRRQKTHNPLPLLKLNHILRDISPDVIHLHYASISRYIFGEKMKSKFCVTLHDMCTTINSKYLYQSGPIFAISNIVKEDIKKWTGLESTTVFNGIETSAFKVKPSLNREPIFRIVQVSRLAHKKKGQDLLIKAIAKLIKCGITNINLTLVGDGDSKDFLKELVKSLGIDKYVHFAGSKPQEYLFEHLCDYDLFVQPSRFEGFGLTVTEAMAAKVPVLVSDNQAPMEIISHGKYGYYFKSEDVDDLSNMIQKIIESAPDSTLVEKAREYVNETFSVKSTARKYLSLYKKLLIDKN